MSRPQCITVIPPRQYQALLEVSESIAEHRDLAVLFRQLAERLAHIIRFDSLWLVLHDPAANCMRLHGQFQNEVVLWIWQNRPPEEEDQAQIRIGTKKMNYAERRLLNHEADGAARLDQWGNYSPLP